MANYEATARTNYFRVTDEAQYQKLFSGLRGGVYDFTTHSAGNAHGFSRGMRGGKYERKEDAKC